VRRPASSAKQADAFLADLPALAELQLTLEPNEVIELLQDSLHTFAVEMGLKVAACLLRDEVQRLCGSRYERSATRTVTRHGSQSGVVTIAGQKLPIERPRVRSVDQRQEIPLAAYDLLQQPDAMPEAALKRMVHGVSCRNYERAVDVAREGYGVKRSSVSRAFVEASKQELTALAERNFHDRRMVAIYIDGVEFAGEMMVVAVGVSERGQKFVLGLRQGATENTVVTTALLEDLADRGVSPTLPTLFVLDGSKALHAAVTRVWGRMAVIQRCQVHKKRNVRAHTPFKHWDELDRRLGEAYGHADHATAQALLEGTVSWLAKINRDAAASLQEGLEETLTVTRLGLGRVLRRSFATTNVIEATFRMVRRMTNRVTRWQDGDMRHRWCTSALADAEGRFRNVNGWRQLGTLVEALEARVCAADTRRSCKTA
jgi:transposase-like protein